MDSLEITELDLDFRGLTVPPARGLARMQPLDVSFVRDIVDDDIEVLIDNPVFDTIQPALQRLKTSHHTLARLIAEGRTHAECQAITGYSLGRISILKDDPAFQSLVEHYAGQVREIYFNVHERLAALGMDVLEELQDRLENKPETFTHQELRQTLETLFDRAGYGPKSTQVHELGGVTLAGLLSQVKDEVNSRQNGRIKTLEAQAIPSPSVGSDPGDGAEREAGLHPESEKVVRLPSPGKSL